MIITANDSRIFTIIIFKHQSIEISIYIYLSCLNQMICFTMHQNALKRTFLNYKHFQIIKKKYIYQIKTSTMSTFQNQDVRSFKTIIIGRSAVGKSTLLLRYVDGQFNPQKPTIGMDYKFKNVTYQNATFALQLWDSAGQQRYRTIVYNYFNLSKAACIVFDITNEDSLNDAKMWLQQLVLHCGNEIPKILLGNKCDLLDYKQLEQQIQKFKPIIDKLKEEYQCEFFAVSAYDGTNVDEAFNYLVQKLYEKNQLHKAEQAKPPKKDDVFRLTAKTQPNANDKKNKKKCC